MALLRVYQKIENNVWSITFNNDPAELSEADKRAMAQFGEPEIELGGVFLEGTANEFTLPSKKAKVRTDFPYTQQFDARSPEFEEDTLIKANAYRDAIVERFIDAFAELRSKPDTFTGEQVYKI